MNNKEDIYLVGDVKFTDKASNMFYNDTHQSGINFLLALQGLMEEFGVVKIDISTDALKYHELNKL